VDAYLLDTTILSAYLDPSHTFHSERRRAVDYLPAGSHRYISIVALAELTFGADLAAALGKGDAPVLREMIRQARDYAVLDFTHHTAAAYSELKSRLASKYLANPLRRDRPKYVEDWVDRTTGKALGVDENDVWMAAHAKERGLVLMTADRRMQRIADADADVRLLIV
jgi:predicted nucleic acid-binding protein